MVGADVEDLFDCRPAHDFIVNNEYRAPVAAVGAYIFFLVTVPLLMRRFHVAPMKLRAPFALWNVALSLFSMWGVTVLAPHLFSNLYNNGLHYVLCDDRFIYGDAEKGVRENYELGATCYGMPAIASLAFVYSKFPELFDTVFLVLKGKPIVMLQWWHHASVLLYAWHASVISTPSAVPFAVMNYAVHSVMYLYFGLSQYTRALGWMKRPITIFQISQMIFGVAIVALCLLYEATSSCSESYVKGHFYTLCGGMYASYLVLFFQFYRRSYNARAKIV